MIRLSHKLCGSRGRRAGNRTASPGVGGNSRLQAAAAPALAVATLLLVHAAAMSAPATTGGTPDQAYLDAVAGRGIQAEVAYLDPDAPLAIDDKAAPEPAAPARPQALRWLLVAVAAAVLAVVAVVFIRNGAVAGSLFARPPRREAEAPPPPAVAEAGPLPGLDLLAELAALPDRRQALQRLTEHALERAARSNGVGLGPGQTGRGALQLLPPTWRHLPGLRLVVRTEEAVRFAGAPLPAAILGDCLAAVRPLFAEHGGT